MRNMFKYKAHQKDFELRGYVEVPVLDIKDIGNLFDIVQRNKSEYNQPFHTTHFSTSLAYKREINETIIKVAFPKLANILENCIPIFGNLMIKHGMNGYFMPLHADWTYVNEDDYRSIAAWIPLVDTDEENGCLGVIEGSHKISNKIRGPRIQQTSYQHDKDWVKKYGRLIPLKAGHAIIFDHALMHFSPPNRTVDSRPALNLSIVPQGVDVVHYCLPEDAAEIEVYKVEGSEFYLNYNNYKRPESESLIRKLPLETVGLVDEQMEKFNPYKKKNFLARIFGN